MPTADRVVVVCAYLVPHFEKLCRLIEQPDLVRDERFATNQARVAHRPALVVKLRTALAGLTTDEALDLLTTNGVVAGWISGYDEARENPDVRASGLFIGVVGAVGPRKTPLSSP
ncbi:CoA transferase [Streptomyces sp. CWNU-1]|uniref:CoA transferase n=1 Tax=Streptomyces albipurpureus TaxID=2897419 RepID=A0ABT0V042_9ACTN|nr:CoA transferase [Streptomyces sp. CWNU-1]